MTRRLKRNGVIPLPRARKRRNARPRVRHPNATAPLRSPRKRVPGKITSNEVLSRRTDLYVIPGATAKCRRGLSRRKYLEEGPPLGTPSIPHKCGTKAAREYSRRQQMLLHFKKNLGSSTHTMRRTLVGTYIRLEFFIPDIHHYVLFHPNGWIYVNKTPSHRAFLKLLDLCIHLRSSLTDSLSNLTRLCRRAIY